MAALASDCCSANSAALRSIWRTVRKASNSAENSNNADTLKPTSNTRCK
jgi:hypothetical protein